MHAQKEEMEPWKQTSDVLIQLEVVSFRFPELLLSYSSYSAPSPFIVHTIASHRYYPDPFYPFFLFSFFYNYSLSSRINQLQLSTSTPYYRVRFTIPRGLF